MAFCSNCGAQIKPETKFCDNCGTPVPIAAHEPEIGQATPAQPQGVYTPPTQQTQSSYTPPTQQVQSSYAPPVQQVQGDYVPPVQQVQGSYSPPAQQPQGSYTPPAQQAQGSYSPPTQQPQGSYTPPAQQAQPSYTPPTQQAQGNDATPTQQAQGGYAPPTQQAYAAQAAYSAPQTAPKQKKPLDKKLLLFGGIGIAAILIIVLIVSLLGGKSDPHVGIWNGTKLEAQGVALDVKEVMGGGFIFDIQENGKCALTIGPEKLNGTWEKNKDGILIKAGAFTFDCKVKGTTMVIENYADSGMTLTLEKEGGKGGKGGATPDDPNLGVWKVVFAEMWGVETDIKDVFENGFTIELLDKGKCKLNIDGTEGNGKWTLENGVLHIKGGGLDSSGTLKDGMLVLEDVLGTGLKLKFQKEGAQAVIASANDPSSSGLPFGSDEEGMAAAFQSPTTAIEVDSYWYGTAILSNFTPANRAAEVEGASDVWGYIGTANNGRTYFEVYDSPEMADTPTLSLYIDLYDTFFNAEIGDEDAWLIGTYLDESDAYYFSPLLENGALRIDYRSEGKNTSYDILIFLREDGAPWDEENDPLPPGYDEYKAAHNDGETASDVGASKPAQTELLTAAQLREAYDAMDPSGMTYEEVRDLYLNGVDGEREERDNPDIHAYVWYAAEGTEKRVYVSFKKNAAGKYVYTSRSINNIS